jgi:hypothetical protein
MLYRTGLQKYATALDLTLTKRFRERVRKGTLIANLDKLL